MSRAKKLKKLNEGFCMLGTSNIVLPVIKKNFPSEFAEKSRLGYYSNIFSSVEVNSTFYKLPLPATVSRWADEVTTGFRFTFKLLRDITHSKDYSFGQEDLQQFMSVINCAGSKKGSLLIQFPAGFTSVQSSILKKLLRLLSKLDTHNEWQKAIEFRHTSWYTDETTDLLQKFSVVYVHHDMPPSATPAELQLLPGAKYYRFHGTLPRYRGDYSDEILDQYSTSIRKAIRAGNNVFAYFNNTLGNAFYDAINLQQKINSLP